MEKERQALLELKQGMVDPAGRLASWVAEDEDCCRWKGVVCDYVTGHVLELYLGAPVAEATDQYGANGGLKLGGKISPSLLSLKHLSYMDLSNNDFGINIPEFFGSLKSLRILDLSNSGFIGIVSEIHFSNLTELKTFIGDGNSLILKVNSDWAPPFQIQILRLRGWNLGPRFPQWLRFQKNITYLDISNAKISDTIPSWFWELLAQLTYLDLSHNQIQGQLPPVLNTSTSSVAAIDFSSNNFTGPLPRFNANVFFLDLSNNNLSGSLFHFLCRQTESMYMIVLNLGQNSLSGELPDCWLEWPELAIIVLANNRFTGKIPSSIAAQTKLISMHLQKNHLSGEIPSSLSNSEFLHMLDLSENELDGSIPSWMDDSFPYLRMLNLRSNKFWGRVPNELCLLSSLQILDLAQNNLSGSLPSCIGNLSVFRPAGDPSRSVAIAKSAASGTVGNATGFHGTGFHSIFDYSIVESNNSYQLEFSSGDSTLAAYFLEKANVMMKGQLLEYHKTLYLVRIIDFSDNSLVGEIPSEITDLQALHSLNLSHNLLTGRIPKKIGNMRMLESLDFSVNKLSDSIPESMSSLTFLSYLNLSNNQLVGKIPSGTQLQSFNASSFVGNKLCGPPLEVNCSPRIIKNEAGEDVNGVEINWFFVSMALGFIVGFWIVVSPLVISRRWRYMYYQFLDEMWWKISDTIRQWFLMSHVRF